jgi:glycerol-3-phosphate cytidylyltransferase
MSPVLQADELTQYCQAQKAGGKVVVTTNGCFDILHVGHVRILQEAKALGDCLVIGLNSDDSVKRLKGESRPINSQDDRAEVLLALGCVDAVYIFDEDTPVDFLKAAKPNIHVKGADYKKEDLAETPVVESFGGRIELLALVPNKSTTKVVEKIQIK